MVTAPRLTGFCNPSNPADSHGRCSGAYVRGPQYPTEACACACHDIPEETTPVTLHVYRFEQRSPDWHARRCGLVTASTIDRLITPTLKVAANDTSRGVVANLAAERITGQPGDSGYLSDDMLRGILHEPYARDRYAEVNGVEVEEVGLLVLDRDGWELGASPDGLVGTEGGVEIKCPRPKAHVLTIIADEVPSQYVAQVQTSLYVSGRAWWDYVSFCAGLPLYTKRVHPDPAWFAAIEAAVTATEEGVRALLADYALKAADLPPTEPIADLDDIHVSAA